MKKIVNSLKELDNHEFIFENTLFKLCYNKNDRMLDLKIRYLDKYWAILYQNITARNIHKLREFNLEIELPITLTSKERHIVEGIKHLGNYFCRDRCGNLWAVSSEPILDLKDGKWKLKFNDTYRLYSRLCNKKGSIFRPPAKMILNHLSQVDFIIY